MTAYRYRPSYRYRPYRFRRRNGNAEKLTGLTVGLALAIAAGTHAAAGHHAAHSTATDAARKAAPASIHAAPVTSGSETAFWDATLSDLSAPASSANAASLADWAAREGCWGCVGHYNPLDTTLPEPGSWAFNTFGGGLHVQSYPTASEGAQATAVTLEDGYPLIVAALRAGTGLCGNPNLDAEFLTWSGDGYSGVC